MYPHVEYPSGNDHVFTFQDCPFSITLPDYIKVVMDNGVSTDQNQSCWFDMEIDAFEAKIHCSYYPIDDNNSLENLIDDAYTFVRKHNIKATFRKETPVSNSFGSLGMIFEIDGPVASPYQFYMTDEENHFLRGSLYFNHAIAQDSMLPIIDYIKADINDALATLRLVN